MKSEKICYIMLVCITIVSAIIIALMGLNVGLRYSNAKQIDIYLGTQFEIDDIKTLTQEVVGNQEIIVRKVDAYDEKVEITLKDISDDEVEALNKKLNEKYGLDNTVKDTITVTQVANVKISDIVKPYILPIGISLVVIIVYASIRYRKIEILEVLGKIFGFNIFAQLLYLSILAITRLPVTIMTIPTALAIYAFVSIVVFNHFETKQERERKEEKKKKR